MKLQTVERNISSTGVMSKGDFGISTNDTGHILSILRDKLYSDKFLAVLREISTNATDANIEAGIPERPIKVTLPTRFEPTLSIRDYGLGLSEEDIYNVYTKYGASTKRNSNEVVGQLGLGSKSPFAYNNTFTIISYHGGIKASYLAYIDSTNCGKISCLGQEPSNETGVCIQVPIRSPDIDTFKIKAEKLYKYFSPIPECNFPLPARKFIISGNNWAIRAEFEDGPMAIMGNISYPIAINRLPELSIDNKTVLQCGIDIRFPIGDLTMSASREALEYTDSTRTAIYNRLTDIAAEITANLKTEFDACSTVWAARLFYLKTISIGSSRSYSASQNIVSVLAQSQFKTWRGHRLDAIQFNIESNTISGEVELINARLLKVGNQRPTTASSSKYNKDISRNDDLVILKNDAKSSWLKRTLHWRDTNPTKNVIVLSPIKDRDFDKEVLRYCVENSIEGIPILTASDLELPAFSAVVSGGSSPVRDIDPKSKAKAFSVIKKYNSNQFPASSNWEPSAIDIEEGTGVYVVINGFVPIEDGRAALLKLLFLLGHNTDDIPIYGIRAELKDKMGPDWEELNSFGPPQTKLLVQQANLVEKLTYNYINNKYNLLNRTCYEQDWPSFISHCADPRIHLATDIILKANTAGKAIDYNQKRDLNIILESMKDDIINMISSSVRIITDIESDYPLLTELGVFNNGGNFRTRTWQEPLANYINLIYKDKYVPINNN